MGLEPVVLERIRHYKRRVFLNRCAVLLVLLVALLISLATIALIYNVGKNSSDKHVRENFETGKLLEFSCIFLVAFGGPTIIWLLVCLREEKKQRDSLSIRHRLTDNEEESFGRFNNGLDGACIAAGVPAPEIIVLAIPGVTSLTFLDKRRNQVIAVTEDALEAPLSVQEAEAVMAEQLAHVLIGDKVSWWNPEGRIWLLFLFVFGFAVLGMGLMIEAGMGALGILVEIVFFVSAFIISVFLAARVRRIQSHAEILTDSIASKITSNPSALKSALTELDRLDLLGRSSSFSGYGLIKKVHEGEPDASPGPYRDSILGVTPLLKRMDNLNAIEKGHWQAFEK